MIAMLRNKNVFQMSAKKHSPNGCAVLMIGIKIYPLFGIFYITMRWSLVTK